MDPVSEIKARLPIEELVGQYCQLQKKGRNFVCLCPFHNDSHPSFLVSPDKGIGYCFACSSGGDIFSFYQKIENVDFPQALKDLAEKAGVDLPKESKQDIVKKDEKDRLRECLDAALHFYRSSFASSDVAKEYLRKRRVPEDEWETWELGFAPDSFSQTYEHLLKKGFSRAEILKAGLGIQKELNQEKIYDRFRNRLIFPIRDHQGKLVAFGGRTLGDDDAKYINSAESPVYSKSRVLYGLHQARDAVRESKTIIMVEGYFDVLACHRTGAKNVVAVSGTALTEEHVHLIKRQAETVVLCLDQDRAGQDAADRSFRLCAQEDLQVNVVTLPEKDPDETAAKEPGLLTKILSEGGVPYIDHILDVLSHGDVRSAQGKREALQTLLPLLSSLSSAVSREHYMAKVASTLGTTVTAITEDLKHTEKKPVYQAPLKTSDQTDKKPDSFSSAEIVLGLFCLYPSQRALLERMIPPEEAFPRALFDALKQSQSDGVIGHEDLGLSEDFGRRLGILLLYCEQHELTDWSDSLATTELRRNLETANRTSLKVKQKVLAQKLMQAQQQGKKEEEEHLSAQYQQVLKLAKLASL